MRMLVHASTPSAWQIIHAESVLLNIWWEQAIDIYYEQLNASKTIPGSVIELNECN